jgi:hypothetical protein
MTADPADLRRMAESAVEAYLNDPSVAAWERLKSGLHCLSRQDPITAGRLRARVEAARTKAPGRAG